MTGKHIADLSDSVDDGDRPLSTPFTTLLSTNTILHFLKDNIPEDTDLVISTVRKGSWIIEDFIRRSGRRIHNITSAENLPRDNNYTNILLFDDSIRTGRTILDLYKSIQCKNEEGACTKTIGVCCLTINEKAMNKLKKGGIKDIRYLKIFEDYERYRTDGKKEMELAPDCQSYYYSHFIIPYVSGLSFNYSPDYQSLSITIKSDSSENMEDVIGTILDSIKEHVTETSTVYRDTQTIRESAELYPEFTAEILRSVYASSFEPDMGKIRISATTLSGYIEVVITPIVSYVIKTDDDLNDLLLRCSDEIISQNEKGIIDALESKGYVVSKTCRFQANKGIGWEQ